MPKSLNRFLQKANVVSLWLAAITACAAYNLFQSLGFHLCPLHLGVVAEDGIDAQILKAVGGLNDRLKQLEEIDKAVKKNAADYDLVNKVVGEVKLELDTFRKAQIGLKTSFANRRPGDVSEGTARFLGGLYLKSAMGQEKLTGKMKDFAEGYMKDVFGVNTKAALTSTDIPLPDEFSPDIVELVFQYGSGRKLATVFPLGALTVKLPKLTTDPTFGLIATSGSITEVSPQIGFVTFTAQKFGGMVRLPTEIDEDSIVGMGQFLARHSARNIARVEDVQVFTSTGAGSGLDGSANGLIAAATADGCSYVQGGVTTSGSTKISQATLADFRNLRNASALSGAVLKNAAYYLHPTIEALLVSFNTSATVTPYQRATATSPATLDGFPINWVPVLPVYSASASATTGWALFGDLTFQYLGLRDGIRFDTSREAAFTTDEILIRTLERLTAGYMATKAFAAMQTSAS